LGYLKYNIELNPPPDPANVPIKLCMDNGNVATGSTDDKEKSDFKSPKISQTIMLVFGKENEQLLEEEMKETFEEINHLVCDMAALAILMGLYTCYKSNSKWRCLWCSLQIKYLQELIDKMEHHEEEF